MNLLLDYYTEMLSLSPIERTLSFGGVRMSGYTTDSLTVNHSGQRVWGVARFLHAKDLFCRFRNRVSAFRLSVVYPGILTPPNERVLSIGDKLSISVSLIPVSNHQQGWPEANWTKWVPCLRGPALELSTLGCSKNTQHTTCYSENNKTA
jgi:hypothetical protein